MDYKFYCVIDASRIYQEIVRVFLPQDAAPIIENYTLGDGCEIIDTKAPSGLVKPRWMGAAWEEGATAKEIAAWEEEHPAQEPVVSPPSQLDGIEAQAAYTAMMTDTLLEG